DPPYVSSGIAYVKPTFDDPKEFVQKDFYINASIKGFWIYNQATGQIYAKITPESRVAEQAKDEAARSAYLANLKINDLKIGRLVTGQYGAVGKIYNLGDQPISSVRLLLSLLSKDNYILSQERVELTFANPVGVSQRSSVLEPHSSSDFTVFINSPPKKWGKAA